MGMSTVEMDPIRAAAIAARHYTVTSATTAGAGGTYYFDVPSWRWRHLIQTAEKVDGQDRIIFRLVNGHFVDMEK